MLCVFPVYGIMILCSLPVQVFPVLGTIILFFCDVTLLYFHIEGPIVIFHVWPYSTTLSHSTVFPYVGMYVPIVIFHVWHYTTVLSQYCTVFPYVDTVPITIFLVTLQYFVWQCSTVLHFYREPIYFLWHFLVPLFYYCIPWSIILYVIIFPYRVYIHCMHRFPM